MKNMRKASIREFHANTSALVREAAEGITIVIERRGKPVAELAPLAQSKVTPHKQEVNIDLASKDRNRQR
jgi:antitoxin (DNA-binding transcriptional repressor) of toxin-antitoxin stability system